MLGATCFPTDIVVAQTWDPQMGFLMGESLGKEMVFYNQDVVLGPGMNIHRDPLCGRNFEYFSEDPVISGKMAAAVTKGVQSLSGTSVCPCIRYRRDCFPECPAPRRKRYAQSG